MVLSGAGPAGGNVASNGASAATPVHLHAHATCVWGQSLMPVALVARPASAEDVAVGIKEVWGHWCYVYTDGVAVQGVFVLGCWACVGRGCGCGH